LLAVAGVQDLLHAALNVDMGQVGAFQACHQFKQLEQGAGDLLDRMGGADSAGHLGQQAIGERGFYALHGRPYGQEDVHLSMIIQD
jgi:hypothetical protein